MKKVLVVDDAKSIRTLLAKCLELDGFEVETAADGKSALDLLLRGQFDLVFLDIKLPVVSGTEVLRRMRDKGIPIPVVIITAFGNIKNAIDCTRLGAVAYVQKPFTANRINAVLDELGLKSGEGGEKPYLDEAKELLGRSRFEEVERLLKNALADNPLDAEVYRMLCESCEKLGRPKEAEKYKRLFEAIKEE